MSFLDVPDYAKNKGRVGIFVKPKVDDKNIGSIDCHGNNDNVQ